jgi:hypothetical protein
MFSSKFVKRNISAAILVLLCTLCAVRVRAQQRAPVPAPSAAATDTTTAKKAKWWQYFTKPMPARQGAVYFIPIPIFSVNPTSAFQFGVGAALNWFSGNPADTRISGASAGIAYSVKKQTTTSLKTVIYTSHDNWMLQGDWRYQATSTPGFGIGTGKQSATLATPAVVINDNPYATQPPGVKVIKYNFARIYEVALRRIISRFYMGAGYHLDYYYHVNDQLLNLNAPNPVITAYYAYNVANGFSQTSTLLSGASVEALYDTRDNQNTPHKGRYALLQFRYNSTYLGSSKNSSTIYAEYRDYINFTRDNHNILAFWTFGNFLTSGALPYWNLPTIGWDQFSKSGEGYVRNRFKGEELIFGQTEYRRHLFGIKNNPAFMGMVLFANATTASSKESGIPLFKYVDPAFGAGLRVNVSPVARIKLAIDYAIGFYGSMGLYFGLNETF